MLLKLFLCPKNRDHYCILTMIVLTIIYSIYPHNIYAQKEAANTNTNEKIKLKQLKKIVATMQPGEWREIPKTSAPLLTRTEYDSSMASAPAGSHGFWGVVGPSGVFRAWGGAGFDDTNYDWYFTGGGHKDYGGNEVYRFNFDTLSWKRLTDPSPYNPETKQPYKGPVSRHTYDAVVWWPATQSLWVGGASGYLPGGDQQSPPQGIWEFDPKMRKWVFHEHKGLPSPTSLIVHPKRNVLWGFFGLGQQGFQREYQTDGSAKVVDYGYFGDHMTSTTLFTAKHDEIYVIDRGGGMNRAITATAGNGRIVLVDRWPQDVQHLYNKGIAYDSVYDRFVFWDGSKTIWTWDIGDKKFRSFQTKVSPPFDESISNGSFGKFIYLHKVDVFAAYGHSKGNVWLYKAAPPEVGTPLDLNVPRSTIGKQAFTSIQASFNAAKNGDTVTILPGIWKEGATITADNVTIEASGAHLKDTAVGGKATLVIQGDNTVIRGLEVSGAAVSGGNGAAIRQEGKNLTLQNVYFHDGQQGVLAGNNSDSTVIVEDSVFERLGYGGSAHGIYINRIDELIIRNSKFLSSKGEGHEIKSRAAKTTIENSIVASLEGVDSRLIDVPNGGVVVIRNNVLQMGSKTANNDMIGVGLEQRGGEGPDYHQWPENSTLIEGNIIIDDRGRDSTLVHWRDVPEPVVLKNIVIGFSKKQVPAGNTWHHDRSTAGLPPYPHLPKILQSDGGATR